MTPGERVADGRAWTGADLPLKEALVVRLARDDLAPLLAVARRLLATGRPFWSFSAEHFDEPRLWARLATPLAEVRDGRGFAIVAGLPVEVAPELLKFVFWGFGTFFGQGQSQSNLGERIGKVQDVTHVDPHARGYRNAKELTLHTDICDMIALLAVRSARSGGESAVASAHAVHDLFLAERPDLLPVLHEGYYYHRRGEEAPGEEPITPHRVPVFSLHGGALSLRYVRPYLTHALQAHGAEHPRLIEASDTLDAFAGRVKATFRLEPGEALILNNLTVMHARSAFEDWPEVERKRLILRLWLNAPGFRPQTPDLHVYGRGDGIPFVAGRTGSYEDFG